MIPSLKSNRLTSNTNVRIGKSSLFIGWKSGKYCYSFSIWKHPTSISFFWNHRWFEKISSFKNGGDIRHWQTFLHGWHKCFRQFAFQLYEVLQSLISLNLNFNPLGFMIYDFSFGRWSPVGVWARSDSVVLSLFAIGIYEIGRMRIRALETLWHYDFEWSWSSLLV